MYYLKAQIELTMGIMRQDLMQLFIPNIDI